jgi:hypothetical protein
MEEQAMNYNEWIAHIRAERRNCAEKLAQYGDKPVVSAQERQRIADKTRVTIHTTNQ